MIKSMDLSGMGWGVLTDVDVYLGMTIGSVWDALLYGEGWNRNNNESDGTTRMSL